MIIERDLFLGIDPGQSGGLALLDSSGRIVEVEKMPETEKDINDFIQEFEPRIRFAYIEKVTPMPKQGLGSTWTFGQHYGMLRGLLIAHGVPFDQIRPQEWQKSLSCLTKGNKNITKAKAQQLYPEVKITHATADALLIALCATRRSQ